VTFKFRTVADSRPSDSECPRCGATMTVVVFSDGTEKTACDVDENHDGRVCAAVGHPEAWADATACTLCAAQVSGWVRCEVGEGRAYTYVSFEEVALERGEEVVLPGNVVQRDPFKGRVLRLLDGPDASYAGPYKAVMRRVEPIVPDEQVDQECTCDGPAMDDFCPHHGLL
jgi:hypothetical protein